MTLLLFTRRGCCLCEGLADRLRALEPPPELETRDVDADPGLQARYGLTVPVLALPLPQALGGGWRELPQVPPRLSGERLRIWLLRHGFFQESA